MIEDRRQHQRVEVFQVKQTDHNLLPVWMFSPSGEESSCGLITDLSYRGASLLIAKPLLKDNTQVELIDVQLSNERTMDTLNLHGTIIWSENHYSIEHAQVGIHFSALSDEQEKLLGVLLSYLEDDKNHLLRCDLQLS